MAEQATHLRVDDEGSIRVITIDRPEARNAMTVAMRTRLVELFDAAATDDSVEVVVLTAVDPVFSGGVDLKEVRETAPSSGPPRVMSRNPAQAVADLRKPVLAAINGACVTGGLEIALACDILVASEKAFFRDTHASLGLLPAWGLSARLAQAIGLRRAKELSITGNVLPVAEAYQLGLVNHVVAHDELMPFTMKLAGDIVAAEPKAVVKMIELYNGGDGTSLEHRLELEKAAIKGWVVDREVTANRRAAVAAKGSSAVAAKNG